MSSKPLNWLYGVLSVMPLAVVAAVYPVFPQTIPAHWNAAGQIDRYGSRAEIFIFPAVIVALAVFFLLFFCLIDKSTEGKNRKPLLICRFCVIVVLDILCFATLLLQYNTVQGKSAPDLFRVAAVLISLLDIVLANWMPKCRRNGWFGIRTPWTLASDEVWHKTHRFGGWLMLIVGLLSLVLSLVLRGIACIFAVLAGEVLLLAVLMPYSFILYRKESAKHD